MAGYGAEYQHEPVTFSQALLHHTSTLKLIVALLPGPWNPAVAAKQIASIDNYTNGRVAVNVVSGWFKAEFTSIGQWWLDHAERYRRSREFISCLKGIWTDDKFSFQGDFYQFHDYNLQPKPLKWEGRPYPEIFQGGNSIDARENAAKVSDYYFMNGNSKFPNTPSGGMASRCSAELLSLLTLSRLLLCLLLPLFRSPTGSCMLVSYVSVFCVLLACASLLLRVLLPVVFIRFFFFLPTPSICCLSTNSFCLFIY